MRRLGLRTLTALSVLALIAALLTPAAAQQSQPENEASAPATASATLIDADGEETGVVAFAEMPMPGMSAVVAEVSGLEPGFHGFHIHAGDSCTDEEGEPDFARAEGHYGHDEDTHHGDHAGDLPVLYADADGDALAVYATDRFAVEEVVSRTVIVHAEPDNLAHIPERYEPVIPGQDVPDETTLATGDAGDRVACGVITDQPVDRGDGTGIVGGQEVAPLPPMVGQAAGVLVDTDLEEVGQVRFAGLADGRTIVSAALPQGLEEPDFHGFHIHAGDSCTDDEGQADFGEAGAHLGHEEGPTGDDHGDHAGDMPPLLGTSDGSTITSFATDRVEPADAIGRTVIVHADRDNLAHIPERYRSTDPPSPPGPDAATRATGDAGDRLYCAQIAPDGLPVQLAGENRYETAVRVSQSSFPEAASAESAVLARGDAFPDGLAGTPLAVALDGPLLLTPPDALPDVVAGELERILDEGATVRLLGGEQALSADVASAVSDLGFETERIFGENRYETAIAVAEELDEPDTVLIATGQAFPDALAAGAAAVQANGVVVLSDGENPHPATDAYLGEHEDAERYGIGGPAARAYPDAEALIGEHRYETAVLVAEAFFDGEGDLAVGLARGTAPGAAAAQAFADALSGGAHVARLGSPMLLTPTEELHPDTEGLVCEWHERVGTVYGFGGEAALQMGVLQRAAEVAIGSC